MNPHRIVIAGAGYAGVSCVLRLARRAPSNVAITLVGTTDRIMERIGISGIQWVRGHDERDVPDTYPSGL